MRALPRIFAARLLAALLLVAAPIASHAQAGRIDLPSFDYLAKKAIDTVNISLDPSLLQLAAQFINNDHDPDADAVKGVIGGLQGIYVRRFRFATDHAYPQADVDRVRKQIDAAGWTRLVSIHDSQQSQNVEIRALRQNNRIEGLVILVTNPREFAIVNIVGSIDLAKLSQLQGKFGVPNLPLGKAGGS